jgi:hypothetical protein
MYHLEDGQRDDFTAKFGQVKVEMKKILEKYVQNCKILNVLNFHLLAIKLGQSQFLKILVSIFYDPGISRIEKILT